MKKLSLSTFILLGVCFFSIAQTTTKPRQEEIGPDHYKVTNSEFLETINQDNGEIVNVFYDSEIAMQGGTKIFKSSTISLINDSLDAASSFTVNFPENTTLFKINERISSSYVFLFVHYFKDKIAPENMKDEIWVVDHSGNIKMQTAGNAVFYEYNKIAVRFETNESYTMKFFNDITFEKEFEYSKPIELFANRYGKPVVAMEVDSQKYFVFSRYEKLLYTFDIQANEFLLTEDNKFLIEIFNTKFELVKTISLDVPALESLGRGIIPMFNFGAFDVKYDLSKKIFNTDDKFEVFYSLDFIDTITRLEWVEFYVANEDGKILKKHDPNLLIGFLQKNKDIEGFDDQFAFKIVDPYTKTQSIQMFNIKNWEVDATFSAVYNGEKISSYFNRIKKGDDFEYLISLADVVTDSLTEKSYGIIKSYNRIGKETGMIKLPLGLRALTFQPVLNNLTLNPKLVNEDNDLEYFYYHRDYYWEKDKNGKNIMKIGNMNFSISNAEQDRPIFRRTQHEIHGDIGNFGLINDVDKNPIHLYTRYTNLTTKTNAIRIHSLPLSYNPVSTESASVSLSNLVYYSKASNSILLKDNVKNISVYNLSGTCVYSGVSSVSTQGWTKGVYIVKLLGEDNQLSYQKLLVY